MLHASENHMRIVSLVPSQTELLYALGLQEEVVGITKFCIHPQQWFNTRQRVGGTKTVDITKVKALTPTIILANKEENVKEQIDALSQIAPVYVSDIANLQQALTMIAEIGNLVDRSQQAAALISQIEAGFHQLKDTNYQLTVQPPRAAYLIWRDPYMAAGGDTFINNMLAKLGVQNIFENLSRYPEVHIDQLRTENCELLLLSSEPYPFKQKHIEELQAHLPATKILLADGEMFSWYGSRLLQTPAYFQQLRQQIFQ